jgi:predicted nucleic acid-binding protein
LASEGWWLVIADTGPINYLVLIGCIDLLPTLFEKVLLPEPVRTELCAPNAPSLVRNWINNLPAWLEVRATAAEPDADPALRSIHEGERAAISLATIVKADLLLMDDRKGVIAARGKGLRVTGTLGILDLAARNGLTDLPQAIMRLRKTNFRAPETLLDTLIRKYAGRGT